MPADPNCPHCHGTGRVRQFAVSNDEACECVQRERERRAERDRGDVDPWGAMRAHGAEMARAEAQRRRRERIEDGVDDTDPDRPSLKM